MKYRNYIVNKVGFIEVENNLGLKVIFTAAGAGVFKIYFNDEEITSNAEKELEFLSHDNLNGKTIGPRQLQSIKINEVEYVRKPEYDLSNLFFACYPNFQKTLFMVQYSFKKKKLLDGFPGKVTYYVTYVIKDDLNELIVDYRALSNDKTPLFMSHKLLLSLGNEKTVRFKNNVLENEKYKVEIDTNYDSISCYENPHGLVVSPCDNEIQCGYSFNKQISYRFIKK